MAEFVYTAVFNVASAVGATTLTASAIAGFASSYGLLIGGMAFSANQAKRAKRKARDAWNAQQVDRLVNVNSSTAERELVLGRVRKGGTVFFRASTGAQRTTFVMCVALAAHEIDAVEQVYLNDTPVSLDGSGNVLTAPYALTSTVSAADVGTGSAQTLLGIPLPGTLKVYVGTPGPEGDLRIVDATGTAVDGTGTSITTAEANCLISYQYTATTYHANIRAVMGTDSQAADARLMELFPGTWTSNHRARGVAYLICEFQYNETAFPTGLPVVTARIRGAKVYDPRENRLKYSEDLRNTAEAGSSRPWTQYVDAEVEAISAAVTNPIGGASCTKLRCLSTASAQRQASQALSGIDDNATVTFSVYAKAAEVVSIGIVAVNKAGTFPTAVFNVSTGTVVSTSGTGYLSSGIESAGNGWYRCRMTFNVSSGGSTPSINLQINAAGGGNYAGAVNDGAYFWGAQAVVDSTAKAYCPTVASAIVPATAWTDNPALLMRHVYQHADFGRATVSADEDVRIAIAANACDTSTAWVVGSTTTTAALFRASTVAPFGTAAREVFDALAQAMGGSWAFAGGQLYLKPGVWSGSVLSLDQDDLAVIQIAGEQVQMVPIETAPHRERAAKFNSVAAQIWDSEQDYKQVSLTPVTDTALVTRDGASLVQSVTFSAISHAYQAQHVAGIMMRDARDPVTVVVPFKAVAYPVELFDTIDLTIPRYGWSAKTFQVLGREWSPEGGVRLTLKETTSAIFALGASFLAQGYAPNTSLPSPWYVPAIGALTITSGTAELLVLGDGSIRPRMRISWPALDDAAVLGEGGQVEVQYRSVVSSGDWTRVLVPGSATELVVTDVQDGDVYVIRARARTAWAVSDWCTQVVHAVVGKSEAPPDVSVFTLDGSRLQWSAVDAVDLAGYEVRFNYGSNTWWDSANPLHAGLLTASPYTFSQRFADVVTLLIKARDTSGNYSTNAASIVADFGALTGTNIVLSWPQAPTFTDGAITAGTVSGGTLVADGLDRFFEPVDDPMFEPGADAFYPASTYADMVYEWTVSPGLAGVLLLLVDITASSYLIEYRRGDASPMFEPVGDAMYTPSSDPFYGTPGAWSTWPGSLDLSAAESVDLRITTAGGATQGVITVATVQLDVPDVVESLADVVISASGTRLPITQSYREIVIVQLTCQADGGSGITARAEDKDASLGPLVKVFDAAGTAVTGLVDARLQGY